jgi:hypothetical protein
MSAGIDQKKNKIPDFDLARCESKPRHSFVNHPSAEP